jgi:small subunit ribosomal protein S17
VLVWRARARGSAHHEFSHNKIVAMAVLGSTTSAFRAGGALTSSARTSAAPRPAAVFLPVRAAQSLQGKVVSVRGSEKTAVVSVDTLVTHPVYKKRSKRTTNYTVQDELAVTVGDIVVIAPCRPLSKTKRFVVDKVVAAAPL